MMKFYFVCLLMAFGFTELLSQQNNFSAGIGTSAGYISSGAVPFWMRSNQFGSIPLDKASFSLTARVKRDYSAGKNHFFDWGVSFESRMNAGYKADFSLIEGYAKMKLSVFELKGGRIKEITGLCDTTLSSGSWSVSGNAPGLPKIQLSIPEYYTIPWLGRLFAFKGQFAHGWFGPLTIDWRYDTSQVKTFLHQKSLYGRFGKPEWKIKLYGGMNHQVFWGHERSFYGEHYTLTPFESYMHVVMGTTYFNDTIRTSSKIGNHLGSIDMGLEYSSKKFRFMLYRQNLYEVGGLYYFANILDGLNGVSLENRQNSQSLFKWKKIVFEFLYTRNQGGQPGSPETPTPYENYYNHYAYVEGWSYKGIGLGNPFITPKTMTRKELPGWYAEYFTNNRVILYHFGFEGSVEQFNYLLKASWSENYGTYGTSDEEQTTGIEHPGSLGIFGLKKQFSFYWTCSRKLKKGWEAGLDAAFDNGELLDNSFGFLINLKKSF